LLSPRGESQQVADQCGHVFALSQDALYSSGFAFVVYSPHKKQLSTGANELQQGSGPDELFFGRPELTQRCLEVKPQSKLHLPRRTGSNQPGGVDRAGDGPAAQACYISGTQGLSIFHQGSPDTYTDIADVPTNGGKTSFYVPR
jgi:hypothetical protein